VDELHTADDRTPWDGLEGTERHAVCVTAAREGNRGALDVLVAELTPLVWHVARGQGLDRAAAEDVVQTVWLAFGRLTTKCQELLRLTVLAGRAEYRTVAEALAMPHGSIGPTRGRCLTLLRNHLETEGGSR